MTLFTYLKTLLILEFFLLQLITVILAHFSIDYHLKMIIECHSLTRFLVIFFLKKKWTIFLLRNVFFWSKLLELYNFYMGWSILSSLLIKALLAKIWQHQFLLSSTHVFLKNVFFFFILQFSCRIFIIIFSYIYSEHVISIFYIKFLFILIKFRDMIQYYYLKNVKN